MCLPAIEWLKVCEQRKLPLNISHMTRRRYIRKLRTYLGIKWVQDIMRHTAASNMLAIHQDSAKVATFMGNSEAVLLRDYRGVVFKHNAEKFMKLLPKPRHFEPAKLGSAFLAKKKGGDWTRFGKSKAVKARLAAYEKLSNAKATLMIGTCQNLMPNNAKESPKINRTTSQSRHSQNSDSPKGGNAKTRVNVEETLDSVE